MQDKARETVSVKDFGAVGDGVADDYDAIMAAHDSLPETGGQIIVPRGSYRHTQKLVFTKRIALVGEGTAHSVLPLTGNGSEFLKSSSLNDEGVVLAANGISVEKLAFRGEDGNGGDGVLIRASRVTLRDVAVFKMGRDGVRVGTDAGGENCNLWCIENLRSKSNGRHGLHVSEGPGALADANAGTLIHPDLQSNAGSGLALGGAQLNSIYGGAYQNNAGYGVLFGSSASYNEFVGGDVEANTTGQFRIESGAEGNSIECATLTYSQFSIAATSSTNTIRCIDYNVDGRTYRNGIKFPGVQVASSDPNTLDDYEEGTFVPVLRDNVGGNAATSGEASGRYTKIGKRVFFDIALVNINTTGLTTANQAVITGLPFTSENASANSLAVASVMRSGVTSTTGAVVASIGSNKSSLTFINQTTSGTSALPVSSITSGTGSLWVSGSYISNN